MTRTPPGLSAQSDSSIARDLLQRHGAIAEDFGLSPLEMWNGIVWLPCHECTVCFAARPVTAPRMKIPIQRYRMNWGMPLDMDFRVLTAAYMVPSWRGVGRRTPRKAHGDANRRPSRTRGTIAEWRTGPGLCAEDGSSPSLECLPAPGNRRRTRLARSRAGGRRWYAGRVVHCPACDRTTRFPTAGTDVGSGKGEAGEGTCRPGSLPFRPNRDV